MSGAVVGFLIMIICGIGIAIGGGVALSKGVCFGCSMIAFGSAVFLIGLIYWIAGATTSVRHGLNWLEVTLPDEPWWAHLVMVLLVIIGAVVGIFVCPAICR